MKKQLLILICVLILSFNSFAQTDMLKAYMREELKIDQLQQKYDKFKNVTNIQLMLLVKAMCRHLRA